MYLLYSKYENIAMRLFENESYYETSWISLDREMEWGHGTGVLDVALHTKIGEEVDV